MKLSMRCGHHIGCKSTTSTYDPTVSSTQECVSISLNMCPPSKEPQDQVCETEQDVDPHQPEKRCAAKEDIGPRQGSKQAVPNRQQGFFKRVNRNAVHLDRRIEW